MFSRRISTEFHVFFENSCDDPQGGVGEPFIFDLRSQHVHGDSSVCVIYHYMGDKLDAVESSEVAEVRAIVTECPDDEMSPILLDSGADAAVFPARFATAGQASNAPPLGCMTLRAEQSQFWGCVTWKFSCLISLVRW